MFISPGHAIGLTSVNEPTSFVFTQLQSASLVYVNDNMQCTHSDLHVNCRHVTCPKHDLVNARACMYTYYYCPVNQYLVHDKRKTAWKMTVGSAGHLILDMHKCQLFFFTPCNLFSFQLTLNKKFPTWILKRHFPHIIYTTKYPQFTIPGDAREKCGILYNSFQVISLEFTLPGLHIVLSEHISFILSFHLARTSFQINLACLRVDSMYVCNEILSRNNHDNNCYVQVLIL